MDPNPRPAIRASRYYELGRKPLLAYLCLNYRITLDSNGRSHRIPTAALLRLSCPSSRAPAACSASSARRAPYNHMLSSRHGLMLRSKLYIGKSIPMLPSNNKTRPVFQQVFNYIHCSMRHKKVKKVLPVPQPNKIKNIEEDSSIEAAIKKEYANAGKIRRKTHGRRQLTPSWI